MGTKFAHFSVCDADMAEVKGLLEEMPKPRKFNEERVLKSYESFFPDKPDELERLKNNPKKLDFIKYILNAGQQIPMYIGKNGKWVTVFSENYSFENIQKTAMSFSEKSKRLFLAFAIFDDDVFIFSLIKAGKIITSSVSGGEFYGMANSEGSLTQIAEALELAGKEIELQRILKKDDAYEKTRELEKISNIKLWLILRSGKEMLESGIQWTEVKVGLKESDGGVRGGE